MGAGQHLPVAHVYAFVETHFHEGSASAYRFPLPGFQHFWVCRDTSRRGGGVSVFVHHSVKHSLITTSLTPELVLLGLGSGDVLLGAVYNPPEVRDRNSNSYHDPSTAQAWLSNLKNLVIASPPHRSTVLVGDFNARVGHWQLDNDAQLPGPIPPPLPVPPPRHSLDAEENGFGGLLKNMLQSLGLGIANGCVEGDSPGAFTRYPPLPRTRRPALDLFDSDEEAATAPMTHASSPQCTPPSPTVLDLALISAELFQNVQKLVVTPCPVSDHASLHIQFSPESVSRENAPAVRHVPCTPRRGDVWDSEFRALYQAQVEQRLPRLQALITSTGQHSTPRTIARMSRAYMSHLRRCKARALAIRRARPASGLGNPPPCLGADHWWSRDLKVAHKRLLDLHHQFRSTGQGHEEYKDARNQYTRMVKAKRRQYEVDRDKYILQQLKGHPRAFWKFWTQSQDHAAEITPDVYRDHMESTCGSHLPAPPAHLNPDTPGQFYPRYASMIALNEPFTVDEVVKAIYRLRNGRSTSDGYEAELLRWARDPNAELPNVDANWVKSDLTTLLNNIFTLGQGIPQSWLKAYVTPVFKRRGEATSPANYRPITVSGLLYKLFSNILLARLESKLETLGSRACTQLGFRKRKGTEQAVWLLHHIITLACSARRKGGYGGPLYACFVDLKQAFDSISRDELWHRLRQVGVVEGPFLAALKSLYASTQFTVKIGDKHSTTPFTTQKGVKQGCPLSPLLFGILMDRLHSRIQQDCPDIGVKLLDDLGTLVSHIMYANDVVLVAQSEQDLQRLVDAMQVFCAEVGLAVNTSKSVVMVFEARPMPRPPLSITVGNHRLEQVDSFKYLGVQFHTTAWLQEAGGALAQQATRAVWALWKGAQAKGLICRDTFLRIYKTQVLPIAMYGAGIWGKHYLSVAHSDSVLSSPAQEVQNLFLQLISGAHDNTSRWVLHSNVNIHPVQLGYFQAAARLWNALRSDGPILRQALASDVSLFLRGHDSCWSHQFLKHGQQVGLLSDVGRLELEHLEVDTIVARGFRDTDVSTKLAQFYQGLWVREAQGSPYSEAPREDSTGSAQRFQDYIHKPGSLHHIGFHGSQHLVSTLFRFRVGAAGLRACLHTPVHQERLCPLCEFQEVEDEKHIVKDCPAYSSIRSKPHFSTLLRTLLEEGLQAFFNVPDQHLVACFISQLMWKRRELLSTRSH